MNAKKSDKVPIIRESSSDGLIMLCVFEKGAVCPENTIILQQFSMAYVIKTKPNDSLAFNNEGCESLPQALTKAYSLAFETSKEIARQEEFQILFEGRGGKRKVVSSKYFYDFCSDYFREEYDLTH